jgi:hypothetical protein
MIDIAPVAAFVTEFFTWLLDVNKITVLATTASALFAGAICWVNWRQLRHTRNVERAYISGGGPLWRGITSPRIGVKRLMERP